MIIYLHSALVTPHLECCVQLGCLERALKELTKVARRMGHLSYEENLRELGLFSLEKRRLQGYLTPVLQYLKSTYKTKSDFFFLPRPEVTRSNEFQSV